jgi:hypothetical protein
MKNGNREICQTRERILFPKPFVYFVPFAVEKDPFQTVA